ncbi:ExbD/TolR family protein [Phaeovulum sp.]|uniref:ExbD/TolR family protein n=1 Tax=Phaeovulum sp. TaxID=2934796 RepID=UPI0039E3153D
MFSFATPKPRRRTDLTPMIDVVFLLLVFFMLSSRFAHDSVIPLAAATGQGGQWQGPARLLDIGAGGMLALNGADLPRDALIAQLGQLVSAPTDPIILRGKTASLQDLVTIMDDLREAGFTRLILVE